MRFIHNAPFNADQIDPEACAFFVTHSNKPYIVFARTDVAARMNLEYALDAIQSTSWKELEAARPTVECREVFSVQHGRDKDALTEFGQDGIRMVSTRPISYDPVADVWTEIYVYDRLPDTVIELLSPLPGPEARPMWPHQLKAGERRDLVAHPDKALRPQGPAA